MRSEAVLPFPSRLCHNDYYGRSILVVLLVLGCQSSIP
ncbi:unannotated protein [freshwater metagenome]|uniref:Unannotated protein n=1 Tax=freshwater metagenome TaxID=449393 RepID=A0A6J6JJW4_9ZZZZ